MKVGEAFVEIRPDTKGFASEAERGIGGSIKGIAKLAAGAFAGVAVAGFFRGAIDEAQEAAKAMAQTQAVIKSTGGVAKVSAGDIDRLSSSLSRKAAVDDELIQSGANVLLTFTKIHNEAGKGNDIFNQATSAALDMSVALGTDMQGAAILVGKALNDPIKGITALTRSGVSFTEQQKEQIKAMVASGDTMGAQKLILKELNTEFAGSAAAQATPLDRLKVAWANLKEEVGTKVMAALAPVATFLADKIPGALAAAGRGFDRLKAVVGPFVEQVVQGFRLFASAFSDPDVTSDGWVGVIERIAGVARQFVDFVGSNLKPILASIGVLVLTTVVPPFVAWAAATIAATLPFVALAAAVLGAIALVERFPVILDVLKAAMAGVGAAFQAVAGFFIALWPQIIEAVSHATAVISGVISVFVAVATAAWRLFGTEILAVARGAWNAISAVVQGAVQIIENVIRLALAIINGDWGRAWDALKGIVAGAWTAIKGAVSAGMGAVVALVATLPGKITGALGNMARLLYQAGRDVIQGFINGIKSLAGALVHTITETITAPINAAKRLLHLGSPSKLFEQFGIWVGEGFANGIASMRPVVERATTAMVNASTKVGGAVGDVSAIGKYFAAVLQDGDYLNDWLSHVPEAMRGAVEQAGINLAYATGGRQGKYGAEAIAAAGLNNPWANGGVSGGMGPITVELVVDGQRFTAAIVDPMAEALRRRDAALA